MKSILLGCEVWAVLEVLMVKEKWETCVNCEVVI